jgi:hypothetical protein
MSYSQLMSQMSLDPGTGTSGTQYDAPHASSYTSSCPPECPRRRHRRRQDTNALTVKFGRETYTVCLSFGGCFVSVDVFFFSFMILNLIFFIYIFTLTSYKIFI